MTLMLISWLFPACKEPTAAQTVAIGQKPDQSMRGIVALLLSLERSRLKIHVLSNPGLLRVYHSMKAPHTLHMYEDLRRSQVCHRIDYIRHYYVTQDQIRKFTLRSELSLEPYTAP